MHCTLSPPTSRPHPPLCLWCLWSVVSVESVESVGSVGSVASVVSVCLWRLTVSGQYHIL